MCKSIVINRNQPHSMKETAATTTTAPTLQLEARGEHRGDRRAHRARDAVRAHAPEFLRLDGREGIGDIGDRRAALRRARFASVHTSAINLGDFIPPRLLISVILSRTCQRIPQISAINLGGLIAPARGSRRHVAN